jgi:hypothetical protein
MGETKILGEKPVPVPLCPPQTLTGLGLNPDFCHDTLVTKLRKNSYLTYKTNKTTLCCNKTSNVNINITLWCVRINIAAGENQ